MKVGSIESLRGMPASIAPNTATLSLSLSVFFVLNAEDPPASFYSFDLSSLEIASSCPSIFINYPHLDGVSSQANHRIAITSSNFKCYRLERDFGSTEHSSLVRDYVCIASRARNWLDDVFGIVEGYSVRSSMVYETDVYAGSYFWGYN